MILPHFEQGSRIGLSPNDRWNRNWNPRLHQSWMRWNARSVCANEGIAVAHSIWSTPTKEKATWMRFGASRLPYPQPRGTILRDWTERGLPHSKEHFLQSLFPMRSFWPWQYAHLG